MPNDYYEEEEAAPEKGAEKPTALLPKSILGYECKPGEIITCKVEHVYEDEVEVSVQGKKNEGEEEEEAPAAMPMAEPAMAEDEEM